MKHSLLNPVIQEIGVNKTALETGEKFSYQKRAVEQYELELISSSYGEIVIDGISHKLKENDMFLRKPGQIVQGFMPYRFRYFTFRIGEEDPESELFLRGLPDKLNIGKDHRIAGLFDELLFLYLNENDRSEILLKARLLEIIYDYSVRTKQQKYNRHVKGAIQFMERNYAEKIDVAAIASRLNISPTYLYQQFKKLLHHTPMGYLTEIRVEKSKMLLLNTTQSATEIAMLCGFNSASYFSYVFQKNTGLSPSAFRKKYVLS